MMSDFVQQQHSVCVFGSSDSWVILSPIEQSIKRKIESIGTPLKDWDIQINYGIKTGYNDAFIISTEKRNEILSKCQSPEERKRTEELIRPILRGRDIKRYCYDWADLYLIATFPAKHYDIDLYPAVKEYLLSFAYDYLIENDNDWVANNYLEDFCKQKLSQSGQYISIDGKYIYDIKGNKEKARKKTSNKWFETQDSINYWEDFSKPKIMYPNMTKYLPFYYDEKGFLQNDKSFMITGKHVAFLTAFLNSSVFKFCFTDSFPELLGGTRELRKIFFDKIPVIRISDEVNKEFSNLINEIQKEFSTQKAIKIDEMIFDLYDLSKQERDIIGYIEIT